MKEMLNVLSVLDKPNKPAKWITVQVTLDIEVPVSLTVDENGPDVVMGEPSEWKLAPVDERTRLYVQTAVEEIVEDEWRDAEEADRDQHEAGRFNMEDYL
jgi:hypothetical protein